MDPEPPVKDQAYPFKNKYISSNLEMELFLII